MNSPYVPSGRGWPRRGDALAAGPRRPASSNRGETLPGAELRPPAEALTARRWSSAMSSMTNDPKPNPPPTPPANGTVFEVRTRRLGITDDDDRPRIVAEVVNGVAELRLDVPGERPRTASVTLYANPGDRSHRGACCRRTAMGSGRLPGRAQSVAGRRPMGRWDGLSPWTG
jgi:hypothetical protein